MVSPPGAPSSSRSRSVTSVGAPSANTERAVRSDLSIYYAWCTERCVPTLPASAETIAAFGRYAGHGGGRHRYGRHLERGTVENLRDGQPVRRAASCAAKRGGTARPAAASRVGADASARTIRAMPMTRLQLASAKNHATRAVFHRQLSSVNLTEQAGLTCSRESQAKPRGCPRKDGFRPQSNRMR